MIGADFVDAVIAAWETGLQQGRVFVPSASLDLSGAGLGSLGMARAARDGKRSSGRRDREDQ